MAFQKNSEQTNSTVKNFQELQLEKEDENKSISMQNRETVDELKIKQSKHDEASRAISSLAEAKEVAPKLIGKQKFAKVKSHEIQKANKNNINSLDTEENNGVIALLTDDYQKDICEGENNIIESKHDVVELKQKYVLHNAGMKHNNMGLDQNNSEAMEMCAGSQTGKTDKSHMKLDYHGKSMNELLPEMDRKINDAFDILKMFGNKEM